MWQELTAHLHNLKVWLLSCVSTLNAAVDQGRAVQDCLHNNRDGFISQRILPVQDLPRNGALYQGQCAACTAHCDSGSLGVGSWTQVVMTCMTAGSPMTVCACTTATPLPCPSLTVTGLLLPQQTDRLCCSICLTSRLVL